MADFDPYLKWLGIRETSRPINYYRLLGIELFESDAEIISMAADRQMSHIRTYQNGPNGNLSQDILNELAAARRCLIMPNQKQAYDQELRGSLGEPTKEQVTLAEDGDTKVVVPIIVSSRTKSPPIATPIVVPILKHKGSSAPKNDLSPPSLKSHSTSNSNPQESSESPQFDFDVNDLDHDLGNIDGDEIVKAGEGGSDQDLRAKRKKRERTQLLWTLFAWVSGGLAAVGVSAVLIRSGWLPNSQFNTSQPRQPTDDSQSQGHIAQADRIPTDRNSTDKNSTLRAGTDAVKRSQNVDLGPLAGLNPDPTNTQPAPTIEQINSSDFDWNVEQLPMYPAPSEDALTLVSKADAAVRKKLIEELGVSANGIGGQAFNVIPGKGGILIGFVVSQTDSNHIKTLQPIYLNRDGPNLGRQIGRKKNRSHVLMAKPGYAVGTIEMSSAETPSFIKLTFMKIKGDRLDTFDTYRTKVMGSRSAPSTKIINPDGQPIVGTYGSYIAGARVTSTGLICANTRRLVETPLANLPINDPITEPDSNAESPVASPNAMTKPSAEPSPDENPFVVVKPKGKEDPRNREAMLAANNPAVKPNPKPKPKEPSTAEKKKAERQLLRIYFERASKVNSLRRSKLYSETLIRDASARKDNELAAQYVMLDEAIRCSCRFGDARTAVTAIRELDASFEINFWKRIRDMISAADDNTNKDNGADFKVILDQLIKEAISTEHFDDATWMIARASTMALRSGDRKTAEQYQNRKKQIIGYGRLSDANKKAVMTLALDPQNQSASQSCGDFLFVLKDNLPGALPYWANSPDELFQRITAAETKLDRKASAAIVELADLWEKAGAENRTVRDTACLKRAIELNRLARQKLDGLTRRSIDNKISKLVELVGE